MSIGRVFEILCWVWGGSEILLQIVTRTSKSGGKVKDRGSLLVLIPAIYLAFMGAGWYGATHQRTMPGEKHSQIAVALAILVIGLAIRWTAILTLGASFSTNVAIHATQTVCKKGLYRWVRHPSYTGAMIGFAAVGVSTGNWISLAIMLVVPTAAMLYRIHVEEMALTEAFGAEYAEYSKTTKRLVPGIY